MGRKGKPKFDKVKCVKCKYHGRGYNLGWLTNIGQRNMYVYCNYALSTGLCTLYKDKNKNTIDRRGSDFNNCLLFEKGQPKHERENISLKGSYDYH